MARAFDFTTVGEISLDTIVLGASARGDGSKQAVQSIIDLPGGQAATAAVGCQRLGWRSRWIGAVGDDEVGRRCQAALVGEQVETHAVVREGAASRRAVIQVDSGSGGRTVFQHRDPRLDVIPGEIPDVRFTGTRILLVDATDPRHAMHAARIARAAGVLTLVDVDYVWPGLQDLLRTVDILIMPGPILEAATGIRGTGEAIRHLARETGAVAVVATLGQDGAIGLADGREVRAAAPPVNVVDTTGAGDAFRAGFAASWLSRGGKVLDLPEMLADANLVAGLSCRAIGAQTALPTALEVPAHLRGPV